MSEKLFAIMAAVDNPKVMLENNLKVEVKKDNIGLDVMGYEVHLEFDNPSIITSNADGFPLWLYSQCTNRRSSNLRNRYFDIVRALGLKEMWLLWEDLADYFDSYADDLPTIIAKMTAERTHVEFVERTLEEFDLQKLLQQTPSEDDVYPYGMFTHDVFSDLFQRVEEIENQMNVVVLGLTEFEKNTIRVMYPDGRVSGLRIR